MTFNSEYELVSKYLSNREESINSIVITELDTNFGRPDIVLINYNKKLLEIRKNSIYQEKFLRKYSYFLAFLYSKGWVSIAKIQNFFSLSEKEVIKIIGRLEPMGLIDTKGELIKSKSSKDILVINRIRVIEAKLTNWKYVIEQAERHLWFSKESSILLPDTSRNIIEKSLKHCEKIGLGLYVVEEDKNIELLKSPSKGIVNTPLLWELNERLVKGEL